jgi:hypothetical protein
MALIGESQLQLDVLQALPKPPDVKEEGRVPGGQLTPLSPAQGAPTCRRNEYLLAFQSPQGTRLAIKRIHLRLPVYLEERELESQTTSDESNAKYRTEAQAISAAESLPENGTTNATNSAISPEAPYQHTSTHLESSRILSQVFQSTKQVVTRSVLPVTIQVLAAIMGPDGQIWSESFDVPINYVRGTPASAIGTGLIDTYADLTNALPIDPTKVYGLAFYVRIPTTVTTNTQLGIENEGGGATVGKNSSVTLFYDIESAPIGK